MIFALSSVPQLESGLEQDYVLRKFAHMAEFGILAHLFWRVFRRLSSRDLDARLVAAWSAILYAFTDELHQQFVAGRHGSAGDIAIDSIGVFLFVILGVGLSWLKKTTTARMHSVPPLDRE